MSVAAEFVQRTASRPDWATPQALFDGFNSIYGFTLDAAASAENAKCADYFTKEDNALAQDWGDHRVWLNPPYGREIGAWMRKAYESAQRGALVVCLVPARTDTAWWHDYASRGEVTFLRGRVRFVGAPFNAPFPSALVVFRPKIAERAA